MFAFALIVLTTVMPNFPEVLEQDLALVHPSWRPVLIRGLGAMQQADPDYLAALLADSYLPTAHRLFAAFSQPITEVRYVLFGEGPYPREESATGVCFMDGAVGDLWSAQGLSKPVNRATSLRNFMKMLAVSAGWIDAQHSSGAAMQGVAERVLDSPANFIQKLHDLQHNLIQEGFLLLNAALVYRPHVAPPKEARAWLPLMRQVLAALAEVSPSATLVLWGKVAEQVRGIPEAAQLRQLCAEHPYNLSFISNQDMQALFGPMRLLHKRS